MKKIVIALAGVALAMSLLLGCEPTPTQADVDLLDRIYAALNARKDIRGDKIAIYVEKADVKLTGNVYGWQDRKTVEDIVRRVPGVKRVENHLKVTPRYKTIPRGKIIGGPGSGGR
ncbi:MAG: BON domain-containing protein [Proteobacteria bacterium]|nr:BON domain-containing protein [Pseudomonadota bacterium]MBU1741097.1 BON domain-containing protein [Pseudomonadota bacterium]